MKRFWAEATVGEGEAGWTVALDGRPVKTPARNALAVPTRALAEAIAAEWRAVEDEIDPRVMPLTGLANAAIDRVGADPRAFAQSLARYAESDLTCYRTDHPQALADRQASAWDPLLAWARRRFDVDFSTTVGIVHVAQPGATVERLSHAVGTLDSFRLAALSPLVTIGGSLVAALAMVERAFTVDQAWQAVTVDERWQRDKWGEDAEAAAVLEARRHDFLAAARFLDLLD